MNTCDRIVDAGPDTHMTREQAIALYASSWWVDLPDYDIALFQLNEAKLCLPFDRFHQAVEKALKRPVWTHEFAMPASLLAELYGEAPAPSFAEIVAKLPDPARVILIGEGAA